MKGFKSATMLYRKGTQDRLHGVHVDTCVVDEHQVEEALDDGWHRSPTEVKKAEESRLAAEKLAAEQAVAAKVEAEKVVAEKKPAAAKA